MTKTNEQTQQGYRIGGLFIPVVTAEPCFRAHQLMKREPVTCKCGRCATRAAA
jgi:hypothetical protein